MNVLERKLDGWVSRNLRHSSLSNLLLVRGRQIFLELDLRGRFTRGWHSVTFLIERFKKLKALAKPRYVNCSLYSNWVPDSMNDDLGQARLWFTRAQVDYVQYYMALYAAFNSWYRVATRKVNDREAINMLREKGEALFTRNACVTESLLPHMYHLSELTQREPLSYASPHWKGEVKHPRDWKSLLEYWYRVRCLVVHGAEVRNVYVYLAYQTLNIVIADVLDAKKGTSLLGIELFTEGD